MNPVTKNYQTTEASQQWSLNPAAYQNLSNDQVDWAALAAQWIHMKEKYPPENVPDAPPPPKFTIDVKEYEEKGEAPMEVEKDDETVNTIANNTGEITSWNSTITSNQPWNPILAAPNRVIPSHWPTTGWNAWNPVAIIPSIEQTPESTLIRAAPLLAAPTAPYISSLTTQSIDKSESSDYWNKRYNSMDLCSNNMSAKDLVGHNQKQPTSNGGDTDDEDSAAQELDAAKRKSLPAWIREGLEKMEREKQKQEEREREMKEREAMLQERRLAEEEAMKEIAQETMIPRKSKFDSDSEDDDYERVAHSPSAHSGGSTGVNNIIGKNMYDEKAKSSELLVPHRTRDELIENLMLAVRKNLTEILLEVTNEEILQVVLETVAKAKKKAPTAQVLRKTTITSSLTGGLGLGIYANSTDESDTDTDDDDNNGHNDKLDHDDDSDLELKELIKRRKAAFEKTSREIESKIAEEEEEEERRRKEYMKQMEINRQNNEDINLSYAYENNKTGGMSRKDGEHQPHDKNNMKYGRSSREKKPSRFSDPKDIVKNVQTHVSYVSQQQQQQQRLPSIKTASELIVAPNEMGGTTSDSIRHENQNNTSSGSDDSSYTKRRSDKKTSNRKKSSSSSSRHHHRSGNSSNKKYKKDYERSESEDDDDDDDDSNDNSSDNDGGSSRRHHHRRRRRRHHSKGSKSRDRSRSRDRGGKYTSSHGSEYYRRSSSSSKKDSKYDDYNDKRRHSYYSSSSRVDDRSRSRDRSSSRRSVSTEKSSSRHKY